MIQPVENLLETFETKAVRFQKFSTLCFLQKTKMTSSLKEFRVCRNFLSSFNILFEEKVLSVYEHNTETVPIVSKNTLILWSNLCSIVIKRFVLRFKSYLGSRRLGATSSFRHGGIRSKTHLKSTANAQMKLSGESCDSPPQRRGKFRFGRTWSSVVLALILSSLRHAGKCLYCRDP